MSSPDSSFSSRSSDSGASATVSRPGGSLVRRPRRFVSRRKSCPFSGADAQPIDYKNPRLLARFISERGKMMPSRITGVSAPKQRDLSLAIKRARFLALLPYSGNHERTVV